METNNRKQTFFILAGESSGDLHGANLIQSMKKLDSNISFCGVGGSLMKKAGLQSIVNFEDLAVMGFWEVIKKIKYFFKLEKKLLRSILHLSPDKIILIDYPGLNLRLAKKIKAHKNIPIFYYISPQLWAWKEKRITVIKRFVDHMIVLFPFEKTWYDERGLKVQYFGHPIIDNMKLLPPPSSTSGGSRLKHTTIALLPGSRVQELKQHLPVFLSLIKACRNNENCRFIISKAPDVPSEFFDVFSNFNVQIKTGPLSDICNQADFAVVASGTATLECAVYRLPMIVIYKMSFLSWLITKHIIKIKFASIVNILHVQQLVPELIQSSASSYNIIKELKILSIKKNLDSVLVGYNKIVSLLGGGSSYKKTAHFILNK